MKSTLNRKSACYFLMLLLPLLAFADDFTRGEFQLIEEPLEKQYKFIAKYPAGSDVRQQITWPKGCLSISDSHYQSADTFIRIYIFQCEKPLAWGDAISVPYKLDAAVFNLQLGQLQSRSIVSRKLTNKHLILQINTASSRGLSDIAAEYLLQGVMHIWLGWDHLAFVFCLCLLAMGLKHLFWTITAFTIGHSISMALSFFKLLSLAIPPIEAIIALSIVLIAREAWLSLGESNKTGRIRMLVLVMLFGLIHGLGFASALEALGVNPNERISALAFFNLGVEAGQIIFVALILALMIALRRIKLDQTFTRAALLFVGSIACFWTIERISSFNWVVI